MPATNDPCDLAQRLLNETVVSATALTSGGNNRVYKISTTERTYAMKLYPLQDADPRDRLDQEFRALVFLNKHDITAVPQALIRDDLNRCGIYEWIDGISVKQAGNPGLPEIDAMLDLAEALSVLSGTPEAATLLPASAHCFSAQTVLDQLDTRLNRLRQVVSTAPGITAFLDDHLLPLRPRLANRAAVLYEKAGLEMGAAIGTTKRTLSPSDFGFHNMLKRDNGLVFVDFEYFGWDDPVKMVSDVLWHPGSNLDPMLGKHFLDRAMNLFTARNGSAFATRFAALHPLFGMIWCLITLNEFLPERWERRIAAAGFTDPVAARTRQLAAAQAILARIVAAEEETYAIH